MLPDEPTDEERQEELPEDNETPFRPASPVPEPSGGVVNDPVTQASSDSTLDDTHPVTDTNMQPEEQYDEGVSGAAEAGEPNSGNAVAGYSPPAPSDDGAATDDNATAPATDDDMPPPPSSGDIVAG